MPSCIDGLRQHLAEFDGRSLTILGEAAARFKESVDYPESLIALAGERSPVVSAGATWMIKAHLESGGTLSAKQTKSLIQNLTRVTAWQAQLHICQSVGNLNIPTVQAERFLKWLEPLLTHERPFVRAWAVNSVCRIARLHKRYRERAETALEAASNDKAASIRARVRNIRSENSAR